MAPRALGALFALVAALAFALALAGALVPKVIPGWWDGHPAVNGKVIDRKDVHVGLLSAYGCNLGETVVCEDLHTKDDRIRVGYAELAALGLIIVTALVLTRSAWKIGDFRKLLGKVVLVEVALVAGGGIALLLVGPQILVDDHPELHIEVPIGIGMMVFWGGIAAAGVASVIAIRLEPEPLRLKRSEPKLARQMQAAGFDVHQVLADSHQSVRPSTPHVGPASRPPQAFDAAPELRPLYDVHNAGVVPAPMPRAAVGMWTADAPSPISAAPSHAMSFPSPTNGQLPPAGPQYAMLPSPPTPPPLPAITPPQAMPGLSPRTAQAAAVPAPRTIPPPAARGKPSVPPPGRGMQPPKHSTISHAIPPPPTTRDSAAPLDGHGEPITAVEIDAEAKAQAAAKLKMTPVPTQIVGDATDRNIAPAPERTDETAAVPPPPDGELAIAVAPAVAAPERPSFDSMKTTARPKEDPDDLQATVERNPEPADRASAPKLERPASKPAEVPISTAPASLPPPKKTTVSMTGPTPACPQCEAPMAWVEEHLRFYCAQCRMYF